jgi:hypothetical protein
LSWGILIGSIHKTSGMPSKKGSDVPNVNEARDRIQKRKEAAKSKEVEAEKTAPENATKQKTPPPSPIAGVPVTNPITEGPLAHECVFVYRHYALYHRCDAIFIHYVYMYVGW